MVRVGFLYRIIPPIFYYSTTIAMIYLAFTATELYFQILTASFAFLLFFQVQLTAFAVIGLWSWEKADRRDYMQELEELCASGTQNYEDVKHYVLIANYNEDVEILEESLEALKIQRIAKKQIAVVLAMEGREKGSDVKAQNLKTKYEGDFMDFIITIHPPDIPGEVKGKGSNVQWGWKKVEERLIEQGIDLSKVVFSGGDADSQYHPKFFEALTLAFMTEKNRDVIFWQSLMMSSLNILTVPAFTRIIAEFAILHEISAACNPMDIHLPYSTYSVSYNHWKSIGGFDVDNIVEDWRSYLKSFIQTNGQSRVVCICLPTQNYSVESVGYVKSVHDRFTQAVRHAWGIYEIAYFIQGVFTKGLSMVCKTPSQILYCLNLFYRMLEAHAVPSLIFIYINIGMVILNYYKWFYPNSEHAYRVIKASQLFMSLNGYFLIFQLVNMFVISYTLKKLNISGFSWVWYPWYLVEFMILSFPAIIINAIVPGWIQVTRLVYTDQLEYITAQKRPVQKGEEEQFHIIEENSVELKV